LGSFSGIDVSGAKQQGQLLNLKAHPGDEMQNTAHPSKNLSRILEILEQEYPEARTALQYRTPFELLLAVILSAQTTDKQVNRITEGLFRRIQGPRDVLALDLSQLEELVKGCGLYRQKSRQIQETSRVLLEKYNGVIPDTREKLMTLPGVGRKSANVIISTAFGLPAMAVDTHVMRVSKRLGLARGKTPVQVEEELCRMLPEESWTATHHRLIAHGRAICRSRNPACSACPLFPLCLHPDKPA